MSNVLELVALCNGDGGHSIEQFGLEEAAKLAIKNVLSLRQDLAESFSKDEIKQSVFDIKQGLLQISANDRESHILFAECALDAILNSLIVE